MNDDEQWIRFHRYGKYPFAGFTRVCAGKLGRTTETESTY